MEIALTRLMSKVQFSLSLIKGLTMKLICHVLGMWIMSTAQVREVQNRVSRAILVRLQRCSPSCRSSRQSLLREAQRQPLIASRICIRSRSNHSSREITQARLWIISGVLWLNSRPMKCSWAIIRVVGAMMLTWIKTSRRVVDRWITWRVLSVSFSRSCIKSRAMTGLQWFTV